MKKKKQSSKPNSRENLQKLYEIYDKDYYSTIELDDALEKNHTRIKLIVDPLEIEELRYCLMLWKKIKLIMTISEKEFVDNITKRNITAGIRSRKGFREIKKLVHELQMKMEIMDRRKDKTRHENNQMITEFTDSINEFEQQSEEIVYQPTTGLEEFMLPESFLSDNKNSKKPKKKKDTRFKKTYPNPLDNKKE